MSNAVSSKLSSAAGLSPVESAKDIPVALFECEAETSVYISELGLLAQTNPELKPIYDVLANRAAVMLERITACRKFAPSLPSVN